MRCSLKMVNPLSKIRTSSSAKSIDRRIDRGRIAALLVNAINHYSPTFAEAPVMWLFASALQRAGIGHELQPVPGAPGNHSRANLIVRVGPEPLALLLVGHVDTIELWHEESYSARTEGDTIYGLGAADMKGGCVAIIEALTAVAESKTPLQRGLCVALLVGEEEEGDGAQALLEEVWAPITVIGEPTSLLPCTSHFGYLETRLVSSGHRAHAALPDVGANAIHAMLAWMMQIIDESQKLPFAEELAINPSEIHGGEPSFVVAENCEALIDFHIPPHVDREPVAELIDKTRADVLETHREVELAYKELSWAPGFIHDHDEDERLIPLRNAFERIGKKWRPSVFRSHSDANLFHPTGTLPIICGPGDLRVAHGRGENISIAEVERAAHLYGAIIYEACVR